MQKIIIKILVKYYFKVMTAAMASTEHFIIDNLTPINKYEVTIAQEC